MGDDFDAGKRGGEIKYEERSEGVRRNGVARVGTVNAKRHLRVGTKSMHS